MNTNGSQQVLRKYWLEELHREMSKQGSGLRSVLVRDAKGDATSLNVTRANSTSVFSVRTRPAANGGWEYVDGDGHRITSADDAVIALWEVRARI